MPGIFAVVHNEDIFLPLIVRAGSWQRHRVCGNTESGSKVKVAAFAQFAFNRNLSLHQFAELFADRETQTRAAVFARERGVSLVERLKKICYLLCAHTDSR